MYTKYILTDMKTAVINFKVDPLVKAAAQKRAKKLGLSLSVFLQQQLQAFAFGESVRIEFPAEPMTPHLEKLIEEVEAEIAAGEVSPAFDAEDLEGMKRWLYSDD